MFHLKRKSGKERPIQASDCFAAEIFKMPLFDFGKGKNDKYQGILTPLYNDSVIDQYIQTQFTKSARDYLEIYENLEHFTWLLSTAFKKIHLSPRDEMNILDIGSGGGNTIFPLLTLFPNARLIASDLSIEMLVSLKKNLNKRISDQNRLQKCLLMQLNAEELDFWNNSFDLITGGAVLHHMISPEKTIQGCAEILKPGGQAIFFEPFEEGHIMLRSIYNNILNDSRQNTLTEDVKSLFQDLILDFDVRMVRDKSHPRFHYLDDKWLFNRNFFLELANTCGFSDCVIYPIHETEIPFSNQTMTNLLLGRGKDRDSLPDWAWKVIGQYDQCFSQKAKEELLIEGCVILKK